MQQTEMLSFQDVERVVVPKEIDELLAGSWHDRMNARAIVLSYLVARAMKVVRFPTRPDRTVDGCGHGHEEAARLLDNYSDQELEGLEDQLLRAYRGTQTVLVQKCTTRRVTLYRSVAPLAETGAHIAANRSSDPIEQFALLAVAAKHGNVPEMSLDFDIVSGWSQSKSNRYGSVSIRRQWPIEDVLLVSDLTVGPTGRQRMESDEWLCINRSPRGMLTIAWQDFDVERLPHQYQAKLNKMGLPAAAKLQAELFAQPTKRTLAPRPPTQIFGEIPRLPNETWWDRLKRVPRG